MPSHRERSESEMETLAAAGVALYDAANLVSEIIQLQDEGHRTEETGSADSDLLGAVEGLESAIKSWKESR